MTADEALAAAGLVNKYRLLNTFRSETLSKILGLQKQVLMDNIKLADLAKQMDALGVQQ